MSYEKIFYRAVISRTLITLNHQSIKSNVLTVMRSCETTSDSNNHKYKCCFHVEDIESI